jgi:hypothetical protein
MNEGFRPVLQIMITKMKFYIMVEVCQPTTSGTNPHCLIHLKEIILNIGKLAITERKQEKRIRLHETQREGNFVF